MYPEIWFVPGNSYPHDRSNQTTRVLQHRLVVERNSDRFDEAYFEFIDGWKVLKPEYDVHHNHSKCVGVVKSGNIGEGCDANPEISSEITKGSEPSYSVEGE